MSDTEPAELEQSESDTEPAELEQSESDTEPAELEQSESDTEPAERVHALLKARGETVATAESLTGGLVAAALTAPGGASAVFRGGLVVYATDTKASLAGVPQEILDTLGPVSAPTAEALAVGVRERLGATYGLATTGVAGPEPQGGMAVGTVFLGLACPGQNGVRSRRLALQGDRTRIRRDTVVTALQWLASTLKQSPSIDSREMSSGESGS